MPIIPRSDSRKDGLNAGHGRKNWTDFSAMGNPVVRNRIFPTLRSTYLLIGLDGTKNYLIQFLIRLSNFDYSLISITNCYNKHEGDFTILNLFRGFSNNDRKFLKLMFLSLHGAKSWVQIIFEYGSTAFL